MDIKNYSDMLDWLNAVAANSDIKDYCLNDVIITKAAAESYKHSKVVFKLSHSLYIKKVSITDMGSDADALIEDLKLTSSKKDAADFTGISIREAYLMKLVLNGDFKAVTY